MKKRNCITACAITTLIAAALAVHFMTFDGISGLYAGVFIEDSTIYAQNYSPASFRRVHKGMTEKDVYLLLGRPLKVHTIDDTTYLWYSLPSKSHFRDRKIMVRKEQVIGKNTEFYVD